MGYDVIIIGSGAGGGTLARRLAPSGKKILILERGDFLKREPENWNVRSVFVENRYVSPDTWYDKGGKAFQPQVHYFVGGATKMYGAALYRLRKEDFEELPHHDGISPSWPISYEEMEPYYTQAEEMYQVHGQRGIDPTEPFCSAPYPFPAVSHEPRMQRLFDDWTKAGYRPFPAPCGIMLNEKDMGFSRCVRCNTCDGFPCLVQAKSDAEMIGVRPALEYPNVTLLRDTCVVKLLTNPAGTAVTEVVTDKETFRGDVVVVSCGAVNSAKLLLQSANGRHPNGLANGSDQVGRNYMFHNSQAVLAFSIEPNLTRFQKTIALNDFYFGMEGFKYPMGNIQMIGKTMGAMFKGEKPLLTALVPTAVLDRIAHHAVDFWLSTEDLPRPENRVTIDGEGKVTLSYTPNNQVPARKLYEKLKSMLGSLGMHPNHLIPRRAYLKTEIPLAGVAHQAGTCRFGTDPKSSVLDTNCKAHELDNLYVVDTSFFPSIGAVNPSLTAMANALRVGDHLLRLGIVLLAVLSGCTLSMSREEQVERIIPAPEIAVPVEEPFFARGDWPEKNWWEQYGLKELNGLVEMALNQNPTIQAVETRIDYAKSQAVIARSKYMPLIYFNASDQWQYISENGLYRALNPNLGLSNSQIDFSLSFFYEFDFWGKYHNLYHAELSRERMAIAETAQAELIATTSLAISYFALRTNLLRKKLYVELAEVRKKYFDLQTKLLENALVNKLEPLLSEEEVFQAEQLVYNIEQEIAVNTHIVNILAGQGPDAPLLLDEPLLPLPDRLAIPANISLELLARRPDLMAEIWRLDALALEVGAAKADFWPNVNITGLLGFQSGSWSNLFEWASKTVGATPGLSLPVYTASAIQANIDAKKALFYEGVYQYNELILQSFNQVADLLSIGRAVYGEKEKQAKIVMNAKARYGLTLSRRTSGLDNSLQAYRFQEELIQKRLEDVQLLFQQYLVSFSLIRALGGGFCCAGGG